jgi:hypothetical protein
MFYPRFLHQSPTNNIRNVGYTQAIDGKIIPYSDDTPSIQRSWIYMPVYDPASPNITCSYPATPSSVTLHASIAAGSTITAYWNSLTKIGPYIVPDEWVHGNGPMLAYMAACPGNSCDGFDGSGAVWFKINQEGLLPDAPDLRGPWKQEQILPTVNAGHTVTIPKNLKAGKYLIRHEIIMMASEPAQFYPQCAQLDVTGEGTAFPDKEFLVSFPGAYSTKGMMIFPLIPFRWKGVTKRLDRSWNCHVALAGMFTPKISYFQETQLIDQL